MSNTIRATVDFLNEGTPDGPLLPWVSIVGGAIGGGELEYHLAHGPEHDRDQSQITSLTQEDHTLGKYTAKAQAAGNVAAQAFLNQQVKGNKQTIATISQREPHGPNTIDAVAGIGGGVAVGLFGLTVLLASTRRTGDWLYKKQARKGLTP